MIQRVIAALLLLVLSVACDVAGGGAGELPGPGVVITAGELRQLAELDGGQPDIVEKLKERLPAKRFVSDGCSGGCPDRWHGVSIYPACFWHDARYYLGGSLVDKLHADARLMLDICQLTQDPAWAVAMFNGVWLGGNLPASWQWGRVGIQ